MAIKPEEVIRRKKEKMEKALNSYLRSPELKVVADRAVVDFVKRVRRAFMPDMGAIPGLSDSYMKLRKRFSSQLGPQGKPKKSNATATGQMLESITSELTSTGFAIGPQDTARTKELGGQDSRHTNAEVASYYAEKRKIFKFSEAEIERIKRNIRRDINKLLRKP